jgi:hypothetical protein
MARTILPRDSVVRIVEGAGWAELRTDDGATLCTMVYGHGPGELKRRARAYLVGEARSSGYARLEPARDGGSAPA